MGSTGEGLLLSSEPIGKMLFAVWVAVFGLSRSEPNQGGGHEMRNKKGNSVRASAVRWENRVVSCISCQAVVGEVNQCEGMVGAAREKETSHDE